MTVPGALTAPASPADAGEALSAIRAGLSYLNAADPAGMPATEQAQCLRGLEQAASMHTAARARILASFHGRGGCQDDGHPHTKPWLRWQTRITTGAAGAHLAWMRRLDTHPAIAQALASASVSESWAKAICSWTDTLPEGVRADADVILLGAAAAGAELKDLAALAEEIARNTARPDTDGDDGFGDRSLRLGTTFRGAGKLNADLTPQATAALAAVLESLGKKAGPEDIRSKAQRDHDALEEACRRLVASGCLPDRAGQPTQIQVHSTLGQLRGLPGASDAEAAWAGPAAGPGADCDATIVPDVTGHVDPAVLDRLTDTLLRDPADGRRTGQPASPDSADGFEPGCSHCRCGHTDPAVREKITAALCGDPAEAIRHWASDPARNSHHDPACPCARATHPSHHTATGRRGRAERAARQIITAAAADLLSGPGGLAAYLRTGLLDGPASSISLPLDTGAATETIPANLRRAVTRRDRRCRFPGCHQPAAGCQPHHIIPRSHGGKTCLTNMLLLCSFHHLIAVHRWGWGIVLMPDGTVTATSPDKTRTYHSHSPPAQAA